MQFDKPDWHEAAACRERSELFFPPIPESDEADGETGTSSTDEDYHYGWQGERRNEWEQKRVCHGCPVIDECLLSAQQEDPTWPFEVVGVMGGTNRYERRWLREATESELALLREIHQLIGRDKAQDWRRHIEDSTPPLEAVRDMNVASTAAAYAIPKQIAVSWFGNLGLPTGVSRGTPWAAKIREILADGAWHPRPVVVAEAAKSVPQDVAENKARKRGKSVKQGATWMVHDALVTLTGSRRGCEGRVEQVLRSDGVRWLRWRGESDQDTIAVPQSRGEPAVREAAQVDASRMSA